MAGRPEKYMALQEFLRTKGKEFRDSGERAFEMTFAAIEALGAPLPASAYRHREWWANSQSSKKPWQRAQFETANVDMKNKKLTFHYVGHSAGGKSTLAASGMSDVGRSYSAEQKCHPAFGSMRGLLRVAAGTDLTEPAADPKSWKPR
jgi:hypothetical protein